MSELLIHLTPELERQLTIRAASRGVPLEAWVEEALETLVDTSEAPPPTTPIWERIVNAARAIPDDERARLPADAPENLDHYLYGAPRQP